jgi:GxxExxY protein
MDTNDKKLLLKEVFQIVGCAIEVLNTLGHGIVEKPYENALVVEFGSASNSPSSAALL